MEAEPKRKRRWFQFRLRTLLIVTAVVALAYGWLASKIEKKSRERQAVEMVFSKGGVVHYYYQQSVTAAGQKVWLQGGNPPGPTWLRAILGANYFSEVQVVFFDFKNPPTLTDADLESIESL